MYKKIKFLELPFNVPIVEFSLDNGNKGYAIIDTASEVTTIDKNFVLENKREFRVRKERKNVTMVGVNGETAVPVVKSSGLLGFHAHPAEHVRLEMTDALTCSLRAIALNIKSQYECDLDIAIILGSDFFARHQAKINYFTKEICFNDDLSGKQ